MKEDMRIGKLVGVIVWVVSIFYAFLFIAERQYVLCFSCIFGGLFSGALLWEVSSCVEQLKGIRNIFENVTK